MHDAQKTETQPLTGVQGQGGPRSHQGRRAPHHHRRALRRSSQPDHQVEAAALGRCRRRLRGGRAGQGGWTLYRRAARQDRRADHGERFFVRCARSHERHERKAMIDRTHLLPVKTQAELLDLSRGSVYYEPVGTSERDLALMAAMDEIHLKLPFYGIRRIRGELLDRGFHVGRGHVATLMRTMGMQALYPKRWLAKPAPGHTVYPYLLRGMDITEARQVWCSDLERHEALSYALLPSGGERTPPAGCRSSPRETGGSLALETQGRVASSPDNDGTGRHCQTARVRQARRKGLREKPVP